MIVVVVSQLRYHAQFFVCVVTRSTTAEFQHNDMMMGTTVLNDLRLERALSIWIVSVHEKSEQPRTAKKQLKTKRACVSICTLDKHITQSTQNRINRLVSHKLIQETLGFPQSRYSGYSFTQSRICSRSVISSTICVTGIFTLCDLFHNLCNWNIHDLLQFSIFPNPYQIPTKYQQLKHRLYVLLNHAVFVMDSFHEATPRIRTNRTALDRRQQTKDDLFD